VYIILFEKKKPTAKLLISLKTTPQELFGVSPQSLIAIKSSSLFSLQFSRFIKRGGKCREI
jgi:hypothetical protein